MQGMKKQDLKNNKHNFRPPLAFPVEQPSQKYIPARLFSQCLAHLGWRSNDWILFKLLIVFEQPGGNLEILFSHGFMVFNHEVTVTIIATFTVSEKF